MERRTAVLIADDRPLVLEGLSAIIDRDPRFAVVATCATATDVLAVRDSGVRIDVYVVDLAMLHRGGLDSLVQPTDADEAARTLVMSSSYDVDAAVRAIREGARGFVSKYLDPPAFLRAIEDVAAGRIALDPTIASEVVVALSSPDARTQLQELSPREHAVFKRVARGTPIVEIAHELGISPKTVSTYRQRVLDKLGCRNNAELTAYALRKGLLTVDTPGLM